MLSSHFALFIDEFTPLGGVEVDPGKVLAALCELPDPRKKRGVRHRFLALVGHHGLLSVGGGKIVGGDGGMGFGHGTGSARRSGDWCPARHHAGQGFRTP